MAQQQAPVVLFCEFRTQDGASAEILVRGLASGMQHASVPAAVAPGEAVWLGSPKTGMVSSVWKVSYAIPEGSFTQYLSDLA
jgi:hypothetical protein